MAARIRILHLEDNPSDAKLVAMTLEAEQDRLPTTLNYVQTKEEYLAALARKDFDIILSDYRMPGYDGDDALASAQATCPDIPFILVTGELGEEFAVERLQRGATDYVLKDRIFRLVPAIKRGLMEAENNRRRKEAESESQKRQGELLAVIQAMHGGVTVLDTEGNIVLVNDAQVAMLGFKDASEFARNVPHFHRMFELRDAEGHLVPLRDWPVTRIMRGETIVRLELKGRRKETGQESYFSFSGQPVRDANGNQILSVLVTRDISERKESERALRQSQERLAATFTDCPIPLSISRVRDGMVLEVNDALLALYGAGRDEVVGKTTFELGIWPDLRERERILEIIRREGKIYESETTLISRSHGRRQILVTVTLLKAGEEPMVLSLLNDITDRKWEKGHMRLPPAP